MDVVDLEDFLAAQWPWKGPQGEISEILCGIFKKTKL